MSHRRDVIKKLEQAGFICVKSSNHFIFKNPAGQMIVVPNHNKMNENTYRSIVKKIEKVE